MIRPLLIMLILLTSASALAQDPPDEPDAFGEPEEEPEERDVSTLPPQKTKIQDRTTAKLTPRERKHLLGDDVWTRDTLGFRFGPVFNGLFGSGQGQPLSYPSFGFRYKTQGIYFDLHAPALFGLVDGIGYLFQQSVLYSNEPFSFFETFNTPKQYAFFEIAKIRLGRTFPITIGGSKKSPGLAMNLSAGLVGSAEIVIFDMAILGNYDPEKVEITDFINYDPIVIAPALFVSLGRSIDNLSFDLSLELGRDIFDLGDYTPSNIWLITLDADIQFEILPRLGLYARPRYTMYAGNPSKLISSFLFSTGAVFHF